MKNIMPRGHSFTPFIVVLVLIAFACLLIFLMMRQTHVDRIDVRGKAQLHSINTAIELFNSEFNKYPPSDATDEAGVDYCGAMKLCEAVMGLDLQGFHPDSVFRSDGTDGKGEVPYPDPTTVSPNDYKISLSKRKGPYLPLDKARVYSLADLYGQYDTGPFNPGNFVLTDVFRSATHQVIDQKVGMPILYYKADTSKSFHDVNDPNNPDNIYNYKDNHTLLALGVPGKSGVKHPMYEDPKIFYEITRNQKTMKPYRADTFILLSAGPDGLYGTKDDIANFEFKWKRE
jgi:type II secretory pathway pseudopilin PulG